MEFSDDADGRLARNETFEDLDNSGSALMWSVWAIERLFCVCCSVKFLNELQDCRDEISLLISVDFYN